MILGSQQPLPPGGKTVGNYGNFQHSAKVAQLSETLWLLRESTQEQSSRGETARRRVWRVRGSGEEEEEEEEEQIRRQIVFSGNC